MKRVILILIFAGFLTACGGGGGAAPSVNLDDSRIVITDTQKEEALATVDSLRSDLDSLENNAEADSLRQEIDALIADINAARHTIEELQNEIAELRSEIDTLKVAETQTEPPPPNCGANEEESNGICKCISGYVRQNGVCELPPPNCDANEMADGQNCVCVDGYQRNNSEICEMIPPIVLSPCDDGQDRVDGNCPPPQLPVCDGMNEVLRNGRCECRDGYVQNNNEICEMIPPPCSDFRERNAQGICTYNTPEFRRNPVLSLANPLPAYEAGAFGQGVTVMLIDDGFLNTHEDLAGQFDETPLTLSGQENRFTNAAHGTEQAGILAAIRGNGKGSHGIAPSVVIVPVDLHGDRLNDRLRHATLNDIPIVSYSAAHIPDFVGTASISDITINFNITNWAKTLSQDVGNLDTQFVYSAGNINGNVERTRPSNAAAYFPFVEENLADNMLMVIALSTDFTAATTTHHCGTTAMWCIGAMGMHYTTSNSVFGTYRQLRGSTTSAATPVVSGALAVLKSAADMLVPQMSAMTTVRLILLETATPLYADASKNGVRIMENGEPVLSSVYGWGAVNIGAGITHLQGIANQMSSIKQMQVARLGGAAKLANGNKFAPANGENAFRFWGGIETENAWTGIATQEYGGISGFAEYGKANMRINSFLTNGEIRNAESQSWTAGIQFGDLIRHNDNLRFSAREESRISDGELILQYSFGKQIRIPIKQKPQTIYTAGYSQKTENSKWSAAAEWNSATNAKGFSFAIELQIR